MAPPFIYARSSGDGTGQDAVINAAVDGNLRRLRGTVERLADPKIIFSFNTSGIGVLHIAASGGHLEVCKYLVEELGGDVNVPTPGDGDFSGVTPFMFSAQSGDLSTVKYLLDHGGDLMRADGKGRTVLHHAACAGSVKITEFLLSKGVPVDMDCGRGTALHQAAYNEQDKTVKILLEHHADAGADVNRTGSTVRTLLTFATGLGGYTNFVRFLLKAGADPNIPDELGRLPIELAAMRDCMEEVEMLFLLTSPIPSVPNWSIDGIISHAKIEKAKPMDKRNMEQIIALAKSQANQAFRTKEYKAAIKLYDMAIDIDIAPSATVYANRSLCKQLLGDGEGALSDAVRCRMLRPNWAKACYRQAAAHMLLKEYKQACDALLDAKKIDPGNMEIERELR